MQALFNRYWLCMVKKLPEGVQAETHYLDTKREMSVQIMMDPHTFAIRKATAETYRTPNGRDSWKSREIPALAGVVAYFEAGRELRKVNWENELEQNLFAETIRGIIQAETYLLPERGFASDMAYEEYWRKIYLNSCRYYSNLNRVKNTWVDYAAGQKRFCNLFSRYHTYTIYAADHDQQSKFLLAPAEQFPGPAGAPGNPGQALVITGALSDSFHELNLVITLSSRENTVTAARAGMLRGPDDVCYEGMTLATNLIGKSLFPPPGKKELAALLGGQNGCVHLIDIAYNLGQTLKYYYELEVNVKV